MVLFPFLESRGLLGDAGLRSSTTSSLHLIHLDHFVHVFVHDWPKGGERNPVTVYLTMEMNVEAVVQKLRREFSWPEALAPYEAFILGPDKGELSDLDL